MPGIKEDADGSTNLDFVIEARPQITVFPNKDGTVTITVTRINHEHDTVERDSVDVPNECVKDIAHALADIAAAL